MSLVELLVAIGVLGGLLLAVNSLAVAVTQEYANVSERITQEREATALAYTLKHYLSRAVELYDVSPAAIGASALSNKFGQVKPYDLSATWTSSSGAGNAEPLVLTFVENLRTGTSPVPANTDRYLPIGVFITRPTTDRFGILAIKVGNSLSGALTGADVDFRFTNIVDFKLHEFETATDAAGKKKIASFMITFVSRSYHLSPTSDYKWCPPDKISTTGCATTATYRDISKTIKIIARDNTIGDSTTMRLAVPSGMAGQMAYVPAPRRYLDGVYFLRPLMPVESLKR